MKLITAHSFAKTRVPSIPYTDVHVGIATIRKWSWGRFNFLTEDIPIFYNNVWTDMNSGTRFSDANSFSIETMRIAQEVRVSLEK